MYALYFNKVYYWTAAETRDDLPWISEQLRFLARKLDRVLIDSDESDLAPARPRCRERDFKYSPCFRCVKIDQAVYTLTAQQAEMIRILYSNWMQGTPDVSVSYVLEQLADQGYRATKIKDLFQRDRDVFQNLIRSGQRRGTLRMNLSK